MYILRLIDVQEEKISESRHLTEEKRCFVDSGMWKCRDHREHVYLKDSYLIVDKYYVNCTQANRVYPELLNYYENPQHVLCSTSRLSYIYELVPVDRSELIQKMRRIAEDARRFRTILVGEVQYVVKHRDRLYVLNFFYDHVLHCMRTVIKYVLDKVRP